MATDEEKELVSSFRCSSLVVFIRMGETVAQGDQHQGTQNLHNLIQKKILLYIYYEFYIIKNTYKDGTNHFLIV